MEAGSEAQGLKFARSKARAGLMTTTATITSTCTSTRSTSSTTRTMTATLQLLRATPVEPAEPVGGGVKNINNIVLFLLSFQLYI